MDKLKELIETFTKEDKKGFRVFINRQKNKKQRKDLQLFQLLDKTEDPKANELMGLLYKKPNPQAYHRLRKRLQNHLTDFILVKQFSNDLTTASHTRGMLSLANYLFGKGSDKLAWQWLKKAEKQAKQSEHFDLLNSIYNLQLSNAHSEHAPKLEEVIKRKNRNQQLADEDERANIAYSLIQQALDKAVKSNKPIDLEKVIDKILKQYQLQDAVFKRPILLFKVLDITRKVMMAQKDFYAFETYLLKELKHFKEGEVFAKSQHYYKISLTYMLAHVLYRNRKFEQSLGITNRLLSEMEEHNKAYYNTFYPNYALLKAANLNFTGKCKEAIALLEGKEIKAAKHGNKTKLNRLLNTIVYYFNMDDYATANKLLQTIGHSDSWCEKQMGKEWVLKKNLVEIVLQYELGNVDIVINRVRSVERNAKELLAQAKYKKAVEFVQVIKLLLDNPEVLKDKAAQEEIRSRLVFTSREEEDLQAMAFYSWIKAKILNQKYYPVLLETVNN